MATPATRRGCEEHTCTCGKSGGVVRLMGLKSRQAKPKLLTGVLDKSRIDDDN